MSAITYKCPNCGGSMIFHPESQNYACEYCLSEFTQEELEAPAADTQKDTSEAFVFTCPSCGAEIAAESTTAATFCYYCHNPVVLSGRLSGDQMPSLVIPFKISQEDAKERFISWIGKKKFVPAAFFSPKQIEKLSGIYFPYWIYDCTVQGSLSGSARDVRIWRAGDIEYTETSVFSIRRSGEIHLRDISHNALRKSQGRMMDGILPFHLEDAENFHTGFLSGFQAEIKDMEKEDFKQEVEDEVNTYAQNLLSGTVNGHMQFSPDSFHAARTKDFWRYVLLPVWVLTYQSGGKMYYFAMNGQTGEICGRLPLDGRKLGLTCAGIFAAVTTLITLIGGLIL